MAEQAKEEGAPPKNNKKLFMIIGAAAAVVIVAVVAVLMLGGGKGEKKGGHGEAAAEKKEAGAHGAAKEGGATAATASVFPLEPFIVNIYDGQDLRYLKIKVEMEMSGPEVKAELDSRQAQLRDAILTILTTKTMQEVQDLQGKNQLRDEILSATGKVLAPGKVTKVFFTDFVVQ